MRGGRGPIGRARPSPLLSMRSPAGLLLDRVQHGVLRPWREQELSNPKRTLSNSVPIVASLLHLGFSTCPLPFPLALLTHVAPARGAPTCDASRFSVDSAMP